jgi:calcineurin-like phosphoesterase family protein
MLKPPFYVISDTHWFHKNIIKYCGRHENHNTIMIDRWNKVVGPQDVILHLGDLVFTGRPELQAAFFDDVAPQLQGDKYLILGNHDKKQWIKWYESAGFKVIQPFNMKYKGYDVSFDHYPTPKGLIEKGQRHIRVHGHIHNNGYQHIHSSHKERKRYGNVNVSVEMIDYTPQPIERVLDKAIEEMKPRQHYVNVNSKSNGTKQSDRHAA